MLRGERVVHRHYGWEGRVGHGGDQEGVWVIWLTGASYCTFDKLRTASGQLALTGG